MVQWDVKNKDMPATQIIFPLCVCVFHCTISYLAYRVLYHAGPIDAKGLFSMQAYFVSVLKWKRI